LLRMTGEKPERAAANIDGDPGSLRKWTALDQTGQERTPQCSNRRPAVPFHNKPEENRHFHASGFL